MRESQKLVSKMENAVQSFLLQMMAKSVSANQDPEIALCMNYCASSTNNEE